MWNNWCTQLNVNSTCGALKNSMKTILMNDYATMEGVTVHPVFVYQPASGIMKQPDVHCHTRHIRAKGCPPKVPGQSPRREKLSQIVHSHILRTTMLFMQMAQTVTQRALPNSAPLHRAPPQLSKFQMNIHHVSIEGGHDLFLTQGAITRLTVSKFPPRPVVTVPAELLHFHQTFPHGPKQDSNARSAGGTIDVE